MTTAGGRENIMFKNRTRLQELLRLGLSILALGAGFALSGYAPGETAGAESAIELEEPPIIMVIGELLPVTAEAPSDCIS